MHDIGRQTGGPLAERLSAPATQELRPVVVVEDAHWAYEATLDWRVVAQAVLDDSSEDA
jgi:hypothetical protein